MHASRGRIRLHGTRVERLTGLARARNRPNGGRAEDSVAGPHVPAARRLFPIQTRSSPARRPVASPGGVARWRRLGLSAGGPGRAERSHRWPSVQPRADRARQTRRCRRATGTSSSAESNGRHDACKEERVKVPVSCARNDRPQPRADWFPKMRFHFAAGP